MDVRCRSQVGRIDNVRCPDEQLETKILTDVRITCITKSTPNGSHEHITHVGSPQFSRNWTVDEVIQSITANTNTFHVTSGGKRANVGVVRPDGRRPYIRTYADGIWNDNLLSLPSC